MFLITLYFFSILDKDIFVTSARNDHFAHPFKPADNSHNFLLCFFSMPQPDRPHEFHLFFYHTCRTGRKIAENSLSHLIITAAHGKDKVFCIHLSQNFLQILVFKQQNILEQEDILAYFISKVSVLGFKRLKARLSEYLRLVKAGETILVTERDEVIAELRPAHRQPPRPEKTEEVLDALAQAGEIARAATVREERWRWKPRSLGLPAGTARDLLDELRADR